MISRQEFGAIAAKVRKAAPAVSRDAAGLAGALLIVAGIDEWSHAAAYIVGGAFMLASAFLSARDA